MKDSIVFKLSSKVTFFYTESKVYAFDEAGGRKKGLSLSNNTYLNIIYYIEML